MKNGIYKWLKYFQDWKKMNQWITWNYLSTFKFCYPNTINMTEIEVLKR